MCDPQLGHSNMREEMTNANPPCLPYMFVCLFIFTVLHMFTILYRGLYMRDLTLIDEGNNNLMKDGLINFLKCDMIYKTIRDVQMYQVTFYLWNYSRTSLIRTPRDRRDLYSLSDCTY